MYSLRLWSIFTMQQDISVGLPVLTLPTFAYYLYICITLCNLIVAIMTCLSVDHREIKAPHYPPSMVEAQNQVSPVPHTCCTITHPGDMVKLLWCFLWPLNEDPVDWAWSLMG